METTFYVGQRVRVTNNKKTYSTHREAFERFGFKDKNVNLSFQNGTEANVFAVDIVNGNDLSVGIRDSHGNESLISVTGIIPIDPSVVLTEWQRNQLYEKGTNHWSCDGQFLEMLDIIESILSSPEPPKYQPKPTIEELQMRIELLENKFAALK